MRDHQAVEQEQSHNAKQNFDEKKILSSSARQLQSSGIPESPSSIVGLEEFTDNKRKDLGMNLVVLYTFFSGCGDALLELPSERKKTGSGIKIIVKESLAEFKQRHWPPASEVEILDAIKEFTSILILHRTNSKESKANKNLHTKLIQFLHNNPFLLDFLQQHKPILLQFCHNFMQNYAEVTDLVKKHFKFLSAPYLNNKKLRNFLSTLTVNKRVLFYKISDNFREVLNRQGLYDKSLLESYTILFKYIPSYKDLDEKAWEKFCWYMQIYSGLEDIPARMDIKACFTSYRKQLNNLNVPTKIEITTFWNELEKCKLGKIKAPPVAKRIVGIDPKTKEILGKKENLEKPNLKFRTFMDTLLSFPATDNLTQELWQKFYNAVAGFLYWEGIPVAAFLLSHKNEIVEMSQLYDQWSLPDDKEKSKSTKASAEPEKQIEKDEEVRDRPEVKVLVQDNSPFGQKRKDETSPTQRNDNFSKPAERKIGADAGILSRVTAVVRPFAKRFRLISSERSLSVVDSENSTDSVIQDRKERKSNCIISGNLARLRQPSAAPGSGDEFSITSSPTRQRTISIGNLAGPGQQPSVPGSGARYGVVPSPSLQRTTSIGNLAPRKLPASLSAAANQIVKK